MSSKTVIIEILEGMWPPNKAKGLLAQTVFKEETNRGEFGTNTGEKFLSGCWLLAPKDNEYYKFRFCFFVHPSVLRADEDVDLKGILQDKYRPFHAIAEFMDNAGVGVVYAVPVTANGELDLKNIAERTFDEIEWKLFSFQNGNLIPRDSREFFERWPGQRGRASFGSRWEAPTKGKFKELPERILMELLLNELFYTGFIKGMLKKPLKDPYDIDSFLISLSQKHIFPMEIKEKFPYENQTERFFGIDVGRIMMLLRLCIPNDSNAVYLIREVDEAGNFKGWKYMTLSDIIMTASWNLQAGGTGMGGQATQTVRLPYSYFKPFESNTLKEETLKELGNMPREIRSVAKQFGKELSKRFHSEGETDDQ